MFAGRCRELRAKLGVPLAAASNALLSLDAAAAPQLARLRLLVGADTATVDSTTWLLSATVVLGANATLGAQSSVALSNPAADGEPGPGADVGRRKPSPGADVGGASPVPVQMWAGVRPVQV